MSSLCKKLIFLSSNLLMFISFGNLIAATDSSNLLNLLDSTAGSDATPKSSASVAVENHVALNSILENVLEIQNNPDYQAALKILSDSDIKAVFRQELMDIQLFFLEYSSQVLQPSINKKPTSLTDLLQNMNVGSTAKTGSGQLSNLINLLQSQSNTATVGVQKQKINLEQFLNNSVSVAPVAKVSNDPINLLPSGQ